MSRKTPRPKSAKTSQSRPSKARQTVSGKASRRSTTKAGSTRKSSRAATVGRKKKPRQAARQAEGSLSFLPKNAEGSSPKKADGSSSKKADGSSPKTAKGSPSKTAKVFQPKTAKGSTSQHTDRSGSRTGARESARGNASNRQVQQAQVTESKSDALGAKVQFIEVDVEHAGQRLDNFLVTRLKGVPKTHIYRIIRKGEVRINKGRVKQTTRLQEGDSIRVPPIRLADSSAKDLDRSRYEFLRKTVLFEDDALLVINKPSGMAVHAGSGIKVGVIEAMRALRTDLKYLELVHRLDRETSGCLVLAKKSSALKILHEDFKTNSLKNKRLDKRYFALVKGHWRFGQRRIIKPLNTDARKHGERYVVVDEAGSYASSIANPVAVSDFASLIEVKLLTGRTHQVRVHTQSEGHPIAGDVRYGDPEFNKLVKRSKLSRLFLHASSLSFNHPITGNVVKLSASLPEDLQAVLTALDLRTS